MDHVTLRRNLERDMESEMRDIIGEGYVPEWYRNLASNFVELAEKYSEDRVKADREKRKA